MFVIYKGAVSFFENVRTKCCMHACIHRYTCIMLFSISVHSRQILIDVEKLRTFIFLGFVFAKPQAQYCWLLSLIQIKGKKIVMLLVVYVLVQSTVFESNFHAVCLSVYHALCINFLQSVLPGSKLIQVDRCQACSVDGVHWDFWSFKLASTETQLLLQY